MTKSQRYYWKHREEIRERRKKRDKEYYLENKEIIKQKCRIYSQSEAGKKSQKIRNIRKRAKIRWYYDYRGCLRGYFNIKPKHATVEMIKYVMLRKLLNYLEKINEQLAIKFRSIMTKQEALGLAKVVYG